MGVERGEACPRTFRQEHGLPAEVIDRHFERQAVELVGEQLQVHFFLLFGLHEQDDEVSLEQFGHQHVVEVEAGVVREPDQQRRVGAEGFAAEDEGGGERLALDELLF